MATAQKKSMDKYANLLIASVTETAANTLTFTQFPQITTLLEKKAYLISRVEYTLQMSLFAAAGDDLKFGISMQNTFAAAGADEPSIVDFNFFRSQGTCVEVYNQQYIRDFSTMPGGGLLIPTRPIFLYAEGSNLGGASTTTARVYFTVIDLQPDDYWDLVQALQAYA